jgi:hypothetical protein
MERATMIASEEEYRIAKSEAEKFERSLASAREREPSPDVDPRGRKLSGRKGSGVATLSEP